MRRYTLIAVLVAGVVTLLLHGLNSVRPYVAAPRPVTEGTAGTTGRFGPIPIRVPPGRRACVESVSLSEDAERAVLVADAASRRAAPRLLVTVTATGYYSHAMIAAGWGEGITRLQVALDPPPRSVRGTVCVRNVGSRALRLLGSNEVAHISRSRSTVSGAPAPAQIALWFTRSEHVPIVSRLSQLFDRATSFSLGVLATWSGWMLAILLAVGLPVGLLAALVVAVHRDDEAS